MEDFNRLKDAESLITKYYEVSKIRNQAERIRQFVEVDKLLKDYAEEIINPSEGEKLRLSFVQSREAQQCMVLYSQHQIAPAPIQEEALVKFSDLLIEVIS